MGKGSSSSESTQTTSTTTSTTDARVGADNGAVVIQAGGQQNISFSPEVANAANSIVNSLTVFSQGVVEAARDIVTDTLKQNESITESVLDFGKSSLAASPSTSESKSSGILTNQAAATANPTMLWIAGGVIVLVLASMFIKKGGKV